MLVGRQADRLEVIADDLRVRGAEEVLALRADLAKSSAHTALLETIISHIQTVDIALVAYGTLPDQETCNADVETAMQAIETNGTSVVSLTMLLANLFEKQGRGSLAVISSVAGDRGRQSNFTYGSAKALVQATLSGLRNRLYKQQISVLDIRPGFVDTPMTAEFDKSPLWAKPDKVAVQIVKGIDQQKDVVYTPGFWRLIMFAIRHLPESLFKRLSL